MDIFCPSKPFSKVDFPAFGGPTMATIPVFISWTASSNTPHYAAG
jgi:hypothetical protein